MCSGIHKIIYAGGRETIISPDHLVYQNMETEIYRQGRLHRICVDEEEEVTDQEIIAQLDYVENKKLAEKKGRYVMINGPTQSGKTVVTTYLQETFGYQIIKFDDLPDIIKTKKSTEDDAYENVTLEDYAEEIEFQLRNPELTLLFDGLPDVGIILPEEPAEGVDRNQLYVETFYEKILQPLGLPYVYLKLTGSEEVLEKRFRAKLELGEDDEMTEEMKQPLVESIQISNMFSDLLEASEDKKSQINTELLVKDIYELSTELPEKQIFNILKSIFELKIILIRGETERIRNHFETVVANIALNHDLFYIDLQCVFDEVISKDKSEKAALLKSQVDQTEFPFQLAFPLLKDYILRHLPPRNQIVVLTGFPAYFTNIHAWPRVMDQFFALEKTIGRILGLIQILQTKEESTQFVEIPVIHSPVKEQPKENEEEQQGDEDQGSNADADKTVEESMIMPTPERSLPREPLALASIMQEFKNPKSEVEVIRNNKWKQQLSMCVDKVLEYFHNYNYISEEKEVREWSYNSQITL